MNLVSWGRAVSVWSIGLLVPVWLAPNLSYASPGVSQQQPGCTRTITRAQDASAALDAASPGDTLCFRGGDLAAADLTMIRSGTGTAPIRLVSDGRTTVHQVHLLADHLVIQGFTITGGDGLLLAGTGIIAQKNVVRDTQGGGIVCSSCTDSRIESNTVAHVVTTGISINGQGITVRANLVRKAVAGDDGEADGIRFFGNGHRIINNIIRDISDSHSACFHSFDTGRPPTFDVMISGNSCQDVAENCLIATGDESGNSDAPAGSRSITFIGNTCAANGEQAVHLRRWPNVDIRKNKLFGPHLKRAVLITNGSTGCTVRDNTTADDVPTVEIDDSSRPGFHGQT